MRRKENDVSVQVWKWALEFIKYYFTFDEIIAIKENVRICSVLYLVKSLKKEFVLRLPDKLRSGDLDPESETFGLDHSIDETSLIAIC